MYLLVVNLSGKDRCFELEDVFFMAFKHLDQVDEIFCPTLMNWVAEYFHCLIMAYTFV